MRILVQWSRATPLGWEEVDSTQWRALPKRPEPTGGEVLDDEPGWMARANIQGVEFHGDHYAAEPLPQRGCRFSVWNDDPEDYPPGERHARVWTFQQLRPDPAVRGQWNTAQTQRLYADLDVADRMVAMGVPRELILPFEVFTPPQDELIRHGIWMPSALNTEHDRMRHMRGWREWTEGVPQRLLDARGHLIRGAR